MRIGYFRHWSQPPYLFVDFMKQEGFAAEKIDYSRKGYLEDFDLVLIEQNGFNDYIENDELYIRDWVKRGGILLFMHQDYRRWAPGFLPPELGYVQLIHRYVPTIGNPGPEYDPYMCYMMPWIEKKGRSLFRIPENITPDEMIDWKIRENSFGIVAPPKGTDPTETVRTAAFSCYEAPEGWEILGSYMDPAVRNGALILDRRYGKGMYFLNQLLFPEELTPESERCLAFWKKYLRNLMAFFERFRAGAPEPELPAEKGLPVKKNYKMAIHMHSLDWYGCDSAPGTINALMRYMKMDICALAVKNQTQFGGKIDIEKYSDDRVLFLHGQEYHPFNWNDSYSRVSHNNYHMLAIGVDPEAYTEEFTRSLFSDEEVKEYLPRGIDYIHRYHGAVCTAHPWFYYWKDYAYDAADIENLRPLSGSDIEKHWLSGGRIAVMNSVDLFGMRRMFDNPAVNFIYLQGETPDRDSVVRAVKAGHVIAAAWFEEADVTLNGHLPGDEVPLAEAASGMLSVAAESTVGNIREVRVYSMDKVIWQTAPGSPSVNLQIPLAGLPLQKFIRVEAEGQDAKKIMASTPFYLV